LDWLVNASANVVSVGAILQFHLTRCNPILYQEMPNADMACSFADRASAIIYLTLHSDSLDYGVMKIVYL